MYAIVNIAGQQFKVEKGKKVFVHRLKGEVGDEVSFDKVMLISDDGKVNVGTPFLPNAVISAQIVSHLRGEKVLVFKKKRRKTYQKLNGHRQNLTEILIEDISESGVKAKAEKKATPKKAEPQAEVNGSAVTEAAEEKKPAAKAKKTASKQPEEGEAKKAAARKTVEKKPSAKAVSKE